MSTLTQALIVNAAVLVSVLATDLGPARRVGRMRILRPLIVAAVIIPLFIKSPATRGDALALELAGTAAGILLGIAAAALIRVRRNPATGKILSSAGAGYATLWTTVPPPAPPSPTAPSTGSPPNSSTGAPPTRSPPTP